MPKKRALFALLSLCLAAAMVSCATVTPTRQPVTRHAVTRPPSVEKVRLIGWRSSGPAEELRRAFMEKCNIAYDLETNYGEYTDKLLTAFAAGQQIDLVVVNNSNFRFLAEQGLLVPVRDSSGFDRDDYLAPVLDALSLGGKTYAIPASSGSQSLFYNVDLFDQAGWPYPEKDWYWAEGQEHVLFASNNLARSTGEAGFCMTADPYLLALLVHQDGERVMTEDLLDTTLDSKQVMRSGDLLQALYRVWGGSLPEDLGASTPYEAFGLGKTAMVLAGSWFVEYLAANYPEINYGVALPPAGIQDIRSFVYVNGYAVSASSENVDAAWRAIDCLNTAENQMQLLRAGSVYPARASLEQEIESLGRPSALVFYESTRLGTPYPYWGPQHSKVYVAIQEALRRVYEGMEVEESFEQGAEEIRTAISAAGQ